MSLTDLPDSDFDLLDKDKSGLISVEEFSDFLHVGLNFLVNLNIVQDFESNIYDVQQI